MAKAKKSKGFLSCAASLLGSIPAVGNVRNAAKKVGKAKKTIKKTVKKAIKTAKRVVKLTKKNVKKSVKKKKKTAAKLKKGLKKAKKKAKRKVKKKLRKKVGKVFTKARKLKNNLSKSKRVTKLKKQMKKTVLKAKKSVKKVKSTAKKVSKSVVQNSKKLSKKITLGARAVNEFVKNGFNGRETASAIADFIPIVGNVKGAYEATFGKDPITGRKLGKVERAAAGAAVIGGPLVKGGTRGVKVASGIVSGGKKSSGKVPVAKGTDNPRIRLPRSNGHWEGEPGNGKWYSDKPEVRRITNDEGVEFINGRPNFTPWSEGNLVFEKGKLNGSSNDFSLVYENIQQQYDLPSKNAAKKLLKQAGVTPHHKSSTVVELIPADLHGNIPHIGSASDLRGGY